MIEPPDVLVLGPYMTNIEGKPGTAMPMWACAPPSHSASRSAPPTPLTRIGNMKSLVRKPVPQMMQSASRSSPEALTTPFAVTAVTGSSTSSTLERASAGRNSELKRIRLQPNV